jgi:hypothetical protein
MSDEQKPPAFPPLHSNMTISPRPLTEELLVAALNSGFYDHRPLTPIPVTPRDYDWWLNYLGVPCSSNHKEDPK